MDRFVLRVCNLCQLRPEYFQADHLPRSIMRPALPDPATAQAIEWIMPNVNQRLESVLGRAWDVAVGMGLGSKREPLRIRQRLPITPSNSPARHEAQIGIRFASPDKLVHLAQAGEVVKRLGAGWRFSSPSRPGY